MERDISNIEGSIGATFNSAAASTEQMAERAGDALGSVGDNLRRQIPGSGRVSDAAEAVSRRVKETADYIREEGMSGIVEDLEVLIRRYPLQTLMLGMGCGYLLSRLRSD